MEFSGCRQSIEYENSEFGNGINPMHTFISPFYYCGTIIVPYKLQSRCFALQKKKLKKFLRISAFQRWIISNIYIKPHRFFYTLPFVAWYKTANNVNGANFNMIHFTGNDDDELVIRQKENDNHRNRNGRGMKIQYNMIIIHNTYL